MSIDPGRWIKTLPNKNIELDNENYNLNSDKWVNTVPKEKNYNPNSDEWVNTVPKEKNYNPIKKYTAVAAFFILGLIFVSLIKEKTRNLQKDINKLEASINSINQELHQATLDYQVITSPKNLSELANKHLEADLISYNTSQINSLDNTKSIIFENSERLQKENIKTKTAKLTEEMKIEVTKRIKKKKEELKKLKEIYSRPEKLPKEIKIQVSQKIKKTKKDLRKLYSDPGGAVENKKVQQWLVVQVVKAFLGIPVIPK